MLLDIDLDLQRVMALEQQLLPLVQTDNHYLLGLGGGFAPSAGRDLIYLIYSINSINGCCCLYLFHILRCKA
uniref:Uncharacterized protein n=1 Tax=Picea glauca TaxID=3330 RepID=A0A101M3N4_PICGL|nr:hypothetical protein ABT39_MTgene253 [Picea glauca]